MRKGLCLLNVDHLIVESQVHIARKISRDESLRWGESKIRENSFLKITEPMSVDLPSHWSHH